MKKIFFSLLTLFFLVSCGPAAIGPEVQNRLDTAYHDGWSSQINQKVYASLVGLPDQQYYQWYKLQMRTAPISWGTIWTWSHWQILPGYDPMYNGSTVSYNFVAQNATAYQFQIFVYGKGCKKVLFSTKCKDGDSGWIVSNAILKIDTTTPGNWTITANDRSTNQWKNDNITNLNYLVDRTGEVSTRVNTFCSFRNPDTGCTATGTIQPITNPLQEGKTTFKYKTCTQAGKCSTPSSFITLVDTSIPQKPTIHSPTHGNAWLQNKNPRFTITQNSAGPSPHLNYYCIKKDTADCDPNTIGSSKNYNNLADGVWYFRAKTCDTGGCSPISTYPVYIDTTAPVIGNISFSSPPGTFLKANSNQILSFVVDIAGGSPIASISAKMEQALNPSTYSPPITLSGTGTFSHNFDISKVDGSDRNIYNYRPYSFQLVSLCDLAGNCMSPGQTVEYNVYANTVSLTTSHVNGLNPLSNGTSIADGSPKNIILTLKDSYGNQVVPVSDTLGNTKRILDFTFAHPIHSLRMNQYDINSTAGAVEFSYGTSKKQVNIGGTSTIFSDSDINHNSWTYTFPVSVYTPTQNRDSKSIGEFVLSLISVKPSDTSKIDIVTSPTVFSFEPLFSASFNGDLKQNGFLEGALQNSQITVDKKSGANPSSPQLYLEFWSGAIKEVSPNLSLRSGTNLIQEWHKSTITQLAPALVSLDSWDQSIPLLTLLVQSLGTSISNLSSHYLSTHISYTLWGKDIVYNQDVIGKSNYHSWSILSNTSQEGIKITGITYTDKKQELTQGQFDDDIRIIWNISKASYKKDISKKASDLIRSIPDWTGSWIQVGDISWAKWSNSWLNSWVNISENSVHVFKNIAGKYVDVSGPSLMNAGSKTLLVVGGDVYIKSDIFSSNPENILAFVVLKDTQGRGGNIYIDPNVTDISAVFYSEKSLMSARDQNNDTIISPTEIYSSQSSINTLANQLYIHGSVFSENTLWGSRSNPLICPYYVDCSTSEEAQKYDLNYMRRYTLVDTDNNNIPDTPANGWKKSLWGGILYSSNPFIIDYNQNIQNNSPPLFSE